MSYEPMKKRRPRLSRRSREMMDSRIEQASLALAAHEEPKQDYAGVDMICNILHYLRETYGMSPDDAIRMARYHYDEEILGRD